MARFTASVSTSTSSDEITGHEGGSGAPQTDSFQVLVDLYDFSLSDFRKKSADMDKSGMLQELFALHPLCMAVFISPKSKGLDIELPPILPADDDQGIENASIGSATAANDENARKRTMSAKRDAAIENEQARKETRRINDALVELRSQIPDVHVPQSCHKDWKNMTSAATYIRAFQGQLGPTAHVPPITVKPTSARSLSFYDKAKNAQAVLRGLVPVRFMLGKKDTKREELLAAARYILQLKAQVGGRRRSTA